MIGRDILVTPVLEPNVSSVQGNGSTLTQWIDFALTVWTLIDLGAFPGQGKTVWRDWWTHDAVNTSNGSNVTLPAPLGHIPVHIRSGAALLLHASPAYTTTETKAGPYSLLISLDSSGSAFGNAYIDDGISLPPTPNVTLTFRAENQSVLIQRDEGSFDIGQMLNQVTVLGVPSRPSMIRVDEVPLQGDAWTYESDKERLVIGDQNGEGLNIGLSRASIRLTWSWFYVYISSFPISSAALNLKLSSVKGPSTYKVHTGEYQVNVCVNDLFFKFCICNLVSLSDWSYHGQFRLHWPNSHTIT